MAKRFLSAAYEELRPICAWAICRKLYLDVVARFAIAACDAEPEKTVRAEREHVRLIANRGKFRVAEKFHRSAAAETREIDFHMLRNAREIGNDQYGFVFRLAEKRKNFRIARGD